MNIENIKICMNVCKMGCRNVLCKIEDPVEDPVSFLQIKIEDTDTKVQV